MCLGASLRKVPGRLQSRLAAGELYICEALHYNMYIICIISYYILLYYTCDAFMQVC